MTGDPFLFRATRKYVVEQGPRVFNGSFDATKLTLGIETIQWLALAGIGRDAALRKCLELEHDFEAATLRPDNPTLVLTSDGDVVRLHVGTDAGKLAAAAQPEVDAGHAVIALNPAGYRAWIEVNGTYRHAH